MKRCFICLVLFFEVYMAVVQVPKDGGSSRKRGRNMTDRTSGRVRLEDLESSLGDVAEPNETQLALRAMTDAQLSVRAAQLRYQLSLQADKPDIYGNLTALPVNTTVSDAAALFRDTRSVLASDLESGSSGGRVSTDTNRTRDAALLTNRSSVHVGDVQMSDLESGPSGSRVFTNHTHDDVPLRSNRSVTEAQLSGNRSTLYGCNSESTVNLTVGTEITTAVNIIEQDALCKNVALSNINDAELSRSPSLRRAKILHIEQSIRKGRIRKASTETNGTNVYKAFPKEGSTAEECLVEMQKQRRLLNKVSRRIDFHRKKLHEYESTGRNGSVPSDTGSLGIGFHRTQILDLRLKYRVHKSKRNILMRCINQSRIQDDIKGEGKFDVVGLSRVEIVGLPENEGENVLDIAKRVGTIIQADLTGIKSVSRGPGTKGRPIVVELKSQSFKRYWLIQGRAHRNIKANSIDPSFPEKEIVICDYLNPYAKRIRAETKHLARQKGYKFVWAKMGVIYVQKDEFHPSKIITNNHDLELLRNEQNCADDPWKL